jgi:hypothetical protein
MFEANRCCSFLPKKVIKGNLGLIHKLRHVKIKQEQTQLKLRSG